MFICEECKESVGPGERPNRIPVGFRPATYPYREYANPRDTNADPYGTDDPGGKGMEIIKEVVRCDACVKALTEDCITNGRGGY